MTRFRSASSAGLFCCGLAAALLLPGLAPAGPADPARHAFERIGPAGAEARLAVHLPNGNRALVFASDGGVSVITGEGLLRRSIGSLPVDTGCGGAAVFAAVWDPNAAEPTLYVSYKASGGGMLSIGRLVLGADAGSLSFERVFNTLAPASCERVGGGLAFASDGTLLLGVGDHGDASSASGTANRTGKILRVTTEGTPPQPPFDPNPLNPASPTYAIGVRDPIAIVTDSGAGRSWFLDRGPAGGADELNLVQPLINHGWGATMLSGHLDLPGDPHHSWDPPLGVSGLLMGRDGVMGDTLDGRLIVSSTVSGEITSVTPDITDTYGSSEETLYTADPTGPQAFRDPRGFADGFVHVLGDDGELWRLRLRAGAPNEPSRKISVVPSILRKDGGGGYLLSAERTVTGAGYGLHVGDLSALRPGYSHPDAADQTLTAEAETGDAVSRWTLTDGELGGEGNSVYLLVGAFDGCAATGLGVDSDELTRPGGFGSVGGLVPVLGNGSHALSGVAMTEILSGADGLSIPRDLEFHPDNPGQLWIVSRQDDSTVIVENAGQPTQTSSYRWAPSGNHFLAQPSALAFGPGTNYFATSHEEDDFTQGPPPSGTPVDFMGPTLWTNNAAIYEGGHASHYDMLHNSPNGAGIAWESGSAYWLFDGWNSSLTRYDFRNDHGLGGADHSDGIIDRYAAGQVSYVPDVVSHLAWDQATDELIVADTGNNRIAVFDPSTAVPAGSIGPNYDGCSMSAMDGGSIYTLIDGIDHGLVAPSGLELHDCKIFVTDNATSMIYAFSRDGQLLDWLDTELPAGSLAGMAFDPQDGALYIVDALGDRVYKITAL
jgi:glucose/arabinose dehydrogenase